MPQARGYFDTSVLVKRYVREAGSETARALMRRYRAVSSTVAPLELMSALHRRRTAGDLLEADFHAIVARVNRDRAFWELVEVGSVVLDRAEQVVQQTALRTLDALHVASALLFQSVSGQSIPFFTSDSQQRGAAARLALTVVWIA